MVSHLLAACFMFLMPCAKSPFVCTLVLYVPSEIYAPLSGFVDSRILGFHPWTSILALLFPVPALQCIVARLLPRLLCLSCLPSCFPASACLPACQTGNAILPIHKTCPKSLGTGPCNTKKEWLYPSASSAIDQYRVEEP